MCVCVCVCVLVCDYSHIYVCMYVYMYVYASPTHLGRYIEVDEQLVALPAAQLRSKPILRTAVCIHPNHLLQYVLFR
jgi:hypothetical protein